MTLDVMELNPRWFASLKYELGSSFGVLAYLNNIFQDLRKQMMTKRLALQPSDILQKNCCFIGAVS